MKAIVHSDYAGLTLAVLTLGVGGCARQATQPQAAAPTNAIAVVQSSVVTDDAFRQQLTRRGRGFDAEQKEALLEELVRTEALYAKAVAAGFDRSPEIVARIKRLVAGEFKERQFKPGSTSASDKEIQDHYKQHAARFATPEAARGAIIFIKASAKAGERKRAELQRQAEYLLTTARAAKSADEFASLTQKHSEDQATRYMGGDLGWVTRGRGGALDDELTDALFALKQPGEFAPLVETPRGFYVLKLLERKEAGRRPLADVREAIRYQLTREKQQQAETEFFAAIKSGLDIRVNRALLESISIPAENENPPSLPGTQTAQVRTP